MNNFEMEIREHNEEERSLTAIAVPYGQTISVGGFSERFEEGSIPSIEDTKLFYDHKEPIGKVVRGTDTEDGYLIEARISETPRGNEVLTLLRDGVLNRMSVGFKPIRDRQEDDTTVREEIELKEVSVVAFPAYSDAQVLSVREEGQQENNSKEVNNMEENTQEVAEVRSELEEMRREIATLSESTIATVSQPEFRSYGEFVKAVVAGDELALEMTRAYAGAVVTPAGPDSIGRDAWENEALLLVDHGRPSLNSFRKASLPSAGLNVDFPAVKANTIDAEVQAAQGDTLAFGKLSLETKTTPVLTIGGWTDMSRQTVERSSVQYVDAAFRAMAIAYGKETNAQFISALGAGTYTTVAATADAESITDAVADASISIYGNAGGRPQFILASPDVWKDLVTLFAVDGRPIVGGSAPVNNIGTASLPNMTANLFGLTVVVDPALPAQTCYIANSEAMVTWENGGPRRLSDEDITLSLIHI